MVCVSFGHCLEVNAEYGPSTICDGQRAPGWKECVLSWDSKVLNVALSSLLGISFFPSDCFLIFPPCIYILTQCGSGLHASLCNLGQSHFCLEPLITSLWLEEVLFCFLNLSPLIPPLMWVIKALSAPSGPLVVFSVYPNKWSRSPGLTSSCIELDPDWNVSFMQGRTFFCADYCIIISI